MNAVMIIPTGIGCAIGGHAGDATPAAKLLAACCDKLILHPNVVNASDINEMPANALYVEGSMLDRFLEGEIELRQVRQNRILLVVNPPIHNETINAASAARATIGARVEILQLQTPLKMTARMEQSKIASGMVEGWEELIQQVSQYDFDALAIASEIKVDPIVEQNYWEKGGVNPWGGVEAIASRLIATALNKPVAHAPVSTEEAKDFDFVADPRMAAEVISWAFLHCVLKGLHRAPRIGTGLSVRDIDCLITPINCVGRPHKACLSMGIPVIAVKENSTVLHDTMPNEFIVVENYLEAAGFLMSMRAGVSRESVRRPLLETCIHQCGEQ